MPLIAIDLSAPEAVAAELAEVNALLGRRQDVPDQVTELVESIAGTLSDLEQPEALMVDPYLLIALQRAAIGAQRALREEDPRRALRVRLEQMRHVFRDFAEHQDVADERSGKEIARWLADTVAVPQQRLADLLGVEKRTFQRWISEREASSPESEDERRLRVIARLVNQLRHALTPIGVVDWFGRPRADLDGDPPAALLDQPDALPRLRALAAGLRSSTAS